MEVEKMKDDLIPQITTAGVTITSKLGANESKYLAMEELKPVEQSLDRQCPFRFNLSEGSRLAEQKNPASCIKYLCMMWRSSGEEIGYCGLAGKL
jgi:hypothetical protein